MVNLILKLNFDKKKLRSAEKTHINEKKKVSSKDRIRKYWEKLNSDPSLKEKLEESKRKKPKQQEIPTRRKINTPL